MDAITPMNLKPSVNATCKLGQKGCYGNGKCHYMGNCEHKILTKEDHIRAMSDHDLARLLDNIHWSAFESRGDIHKLEYPTDSIEWKEWLQQPAEVAKCSK